MSKVLNEYFASIYVMDKDDDSEISTWHVSIPGYLIGGIGST